MSAVATKDESWLNPAQVTESLWPVGNIKRGQLLSRVMPVWKIICSLRGRRENKIARISFEQLPNQFIEYMMRKVASCHICSTANVEFLWLYCMHTSLYLLNQFARAQEHNGGFKGPWLQWVVRLGGFGEPVWTKVVCAGFVPHLCTPAELLHRSLSRRRLCHPLLLSPPGCLWQDPNSHKKQNLDRNATRK